MTKHVKIDLEQPGRALVYIDGVQVTNVTALDISCRPGGATKVALTILPDTVEITGLADVTERVAKLV